MSITKLTTNGLTGTKYDIASADNYYMEPIATTLISSATGTVTFSNIPQGYKHLQVRTLTRSASGGAAFGGTQLTFNGDTTTSNYTFHRLIGDGSSASAYGQSGLDYIIRTALSGLAASIYAVSVIDILDYSNVYKFKTTRCLTGGDNNSTVGIVGLFSQLWMNTAPITSMTFTPSSTNFDVNSRFSLYGVKA